MRLRGGGEIVVDRLTWRPVRRRNPVLTDLDLHIPAGQRVLLVGPSGSGKSTLLRAIAGLLQVADSGEVSGEVRIDGRAPGAAGRPSVGLLLQDPSAGIVAETAGRDVAFGPENRGLVRAEIHRRVRAALAGTGFPYGPDRDTAALSGGETQRLALAGSLALGPPVLLLDEPTSMLDPEAAARVREAVTSAVRAGGQTVVLVEHRFGEWLPFADRIVVLDAGGAVVADGTPGEVLAVAGAQLAAGGVWVPGLGPPAPRPLDPALVAPWQGADGVLLRAAGVSVRPRRTTAGSRRPGPLALDAVDAEVIGGRALAVTGASGAGKSTLVSVLAGLQRPGSGTITATPAWATRRGPAPWRWRSPDLAARVAWVPQLPEHGVVTRTVRDEVLASGRACGRGGARLDERADALLAAFGLEHLARASPYHLSGGEQRRLLVAAALAHGPNVLALDEPTVGQDRLTWAAVVGAVGAARDAGAGVALATHDVAAATLADSTLRLRAGRVQP